MKLSLSWIKDFVNIPEDMDMKQLAYDLTMDTVEVEDVEYLADRFDHMVVGVIEDIEPHPNADKLRVCKVDIGDGEIKDIVCGGINLEKGMRVAVCFRWIDIIRRKHFLNHFIYDRIPICNFFSCEESTYLVKILFHLCIRCKHSSQMDSLPCTVQIRASKPVDYLHFFHFQFCHKLLLSRHFTL